jgi:hypothetical protein
MGAFHIRVTFRIIRSPEKDSELVHTIILGRHEYLDKADPLPM